MNKKFKIFPKCRKSIYSEDVFYKKFNGIYINIKTTTLWNCGEFTIKLNNFDEIKKKNPIIINNYSGELESLENVYSKKHTIENVEKLSENIQKEVLEEIYEDESSKKLYDDDILEEYGWCDGETIYKIYDGFELEAI